MEAETTGGEPAPGHEDAWAPRLPEAIWPLAAAVVAALLALQALAVWATPADERLAFNWFRALSLPLLTGYALIAARGSVRASERALAALAGALRGGVEEARSVSARVRRPSPVALRTAALAGVTVPLLLALVLPGRAQAVLAGNPTALYFALAAAVFWTSAAVAAVHILHVARVFQELAHERIRVDLFHLERLRAFGVLGLRQALYVVGALALVALLIATPRAGEAWLLRATVGPGVPLLVPALVVSLGLAAVAFVQPMWAVHRRIRRAKAEALAGLQARLGPHWEELSEARLGRDGERMRVADLLALQAHMEALPEWPADATVLRRFGLTLLIPLGSLVLQAALEQVFGALVG